VAPDRREGAGPALLDRSRDVECVDERAVREVMIEAPEVTFPSPGAYRLQAFARGPETGVPQEKWTQS
jgi:hypothetical protein